MPQAITTIDKLQSYLIGITRRADHHAQTLSRVILILAGILVLFKDPVNSAIVQMVQI